MVIPITIMVLVFVFWPKKALPEPEKIIKKEVELFKFAVMADIHNDTEMLTKALAMAGSNGNKWVIVAGDLTNNGNISELNKVKKVLDEGGVEYYAVPGNHDVIKNEYDDVFGKEYGVVTEDKLKLILIDNSRKEGLGEVQKEWIVETVADCFILKCLAVMHKPLDHTFTTHVMGEYSDTVTAEAGWLNQLLIENGVVSLYAGHLHYSSGYTLNGMETILVGAVSSVRNNQSSRMTEVTWNGETVTNTVKEIE